MAGTNLPAERTSFVGRGQELATLRELFEEGVPLVTIVGAAGVGKTRLALRHAAVALEQLDKRGGVWLCDLTEARTLDDVCGAMGRVLGVRTGRDLTLQDVGDAIAARGEVLLVIDNCEQIVAAVSSVLDHCMDAAPDASFLVTSRVRLRAPFEHVLELSPLCVPDRDEGDPAKIQRTEGFLLFVDRARSLGGLSREVAPSEIETIAALVRGLDGLPLAIELCAARAGLLGASQLLERLSRPFELLAGDARETSSRHATLRGALDWSWELLESREKEALSQCSVFRGGFTLEAAEHVLSSESQPPCPVLDLLQALHDKSLLCVDEVSGKPGYRRYRLYESVASYASEKLTGAARAAAIGRHATYYAAFGHAVGAGSAGLEPVRRSATALEEVDNLVVIIDRLIEGTVEPLHALEALAAMGPALTTHGSYTLHHSLLDRALAHPSAKAATLSLRAALHGARGIVRRVLERLEDSREDLEHAVALACRIPDPVLEGTFESELGLLDVQQGRLEEGIARHERALSLLEPTGNQRAQGHALGDLHTPYLLRGDVEHAAALLRQASTLLRQAGDVRGVGEVLSALSVVLLYRGETSDARAHVTEAIEIFEQLSDRKNIGVAESYLGLILQEQGRFDAALPHYDRGVALLCEVCARRTAAVFRGYRGSLHHEARRLEEARTDYEDAIGELRKLRYTRMVGLFLGTLGALLSATGNLDEAAASFREAAPLLAAEASLGIALAIHAMQLERAHGRTIEPDDPRLLEAGEVARRSHQVRFALRMLERSLSGQHGVPEAEPASRFHELVVAADGQWFELPRQRRIDLTRRAALRRLLAHLADLRLQQPGRAVSVEAMVLAGWPGERMRRDSAADRVYTTVQRLRRLGLEGILITRDDGYLLDPSVVVRRT